ncbi:MAG: PIN domain-containing protein [Acidobacteriota bacterium]
MTRVFWDTNVFVYLFEGGEFASRVKELRSRMIARGDQLVTSALTLGELLVKPLERGEAAAQDHEKTLRQIATILPFDASCSKRYAVIRADRTIKAPDAIQLACAAAAGTDLFITNDDRLSRKHVPDVKFITSLQRAYL